MPIKTKARSHRPATAPDQEAQAPPAPEPAGITGQDIKRVEEDTDREFFMGPDEAKAYGLLDEVVQSRSEVKAGTTGE